MHRSGDGAHLVVIGAGAAGLMAAAAAAKRGMRVTVIERNREAGRKLLLSGKGRCNVTFDGTPAALVGGIPGNGRFLHSAFDRFGSGELRLHLALLGVETKVERGQRVFPVSDQAASVRDALLEDCVTAGCLIIYQRRVARLEIVSGADERPRVVAALLEEGRRIPADAVLVATGGKSYPGTGSTGDGYQLAASLGHAVTELTPSLVPLRCAEPWVEELTGLSLRNVRLMVAPSGDRPARRGAASTALGEMLFTHFGISGPLVLRASRGVALRLAAGEPEVRLTVDLKPALAPDVLDQRLQRDLLARANRAVRNALADLAPAALVAVLLELAGIDPGTRANSVTRAHRWRLGSLVKGLPLTVTATRGFGEAIVTAGGVDVREVSPQTMESRLVGALYFAGEVLDVDGYTGGYNLQAAFSTGYVAGCCAAAQAGKGRGP